MKLISSRDGADEVYPEEYSMLEGDDGDEVYVAVDGDDGADEYVSADNVIDADEVIDADGDAGGAGDVGEGGAAVDVGRVVEGDAGGGATWVAPDGAGDNADQAAGAAAVMTRSDGVGSGRRSVPSESMEYLKLPNTNSVATGVLTKAGRRVGGCGVNSKEPKEIGLTRGDVDDVGELADAAPTTSRFPTDGAN